jgi:hypothetical protein
MKNLKDLGVLPISTAMTAVRLGDVCEKLSRLSMFGYTAALPASPPRQLFVTPVMPASTPAVPANTPAASPYTTSAPLHSFTLANLYATDPKDSCPVCKEGFYREIENLRKKAETAFKGLCLDCLNDCPCTKVREVLHFCGKDF